MYMAGIVLGSVHMQCELWRLKILVTCTYMYILTIDKQHKHFSSLLHRAWYIYQYMYKCISVFMYSIYTYIIVCVACV